MMKPKDPTAFAALTRMHKQSVVECCFSLNSDQLLTGSQDKSIILWKLPTNVQELHDDTLDDDHSLICYRLSEHKHPIMSVAMHRKLFISADQGGFVNLWKLKPSTNLNDTIREPNPDPLTYRCHTRNIRSTSFSHDARCFATGSDDKSVKIWSTECKNKMLSSLIGQHTNSIKTVRWAKTNEHLLASCGVDGKICIWDTRTKIKPCDVITTRRQFNCLDWHPVFGHHIATGSQDHSCIVWDLRNRKQAQVYVEHNGSVNSVVFNSGGSLLLSGSSDHTSKIFDVCKGINTYTLKSHTAPITSVCFNSTDEMFATASEDKAVTVWRRNFDTINIVLDDDINEDEEDQEEEVESVVNYTQTTENDEESYRCYTYRIHNN